MRLSALPFLALLLAAAVVAAPTGVTCASCHRVQAQFQSKSGMALGLELPSAQDNLIAHPKLTFEKNGYRYTVERKGGASNYTVSSGAGELSLPIQYAFGAHMQTFVFKYKDRFYESMVSYYPKLEGLAITLGDEALKPASLVEAMGRLTSNEEIVACFDCHATNAVNKDQLTLESLKPGVACEHCHTGALTHMEAISQGKTAPLPPKLGQMNAEEMNTFCGRCHRTWDFVVRAREWGEVNIRFAPYRLSNSECFLGDDKRIRCTACHDPHVDLATGDGAYDRQCLACHAAKPRKSCPVAQKNCTGCHMPKVSLSEGHAVFTDHQIRIVHPGDPYPN